MILRERNQWARIVTRYQRIFRLGLVEQATANVFIKDTRFPLADIGRK